MSAFIETLGLWLREFFGFFFSVLPMWFGAWLVCLLVLLFSFRALKPRLRARALAFDEMMNDWARRLRYKMQKADAALEPNTPPHERVLLTWFFRFWTNFASAPSLSVLAFAIPIWKFHQVRGGLDPVVTTTLRFTEPWLLPAFCYFGSMGLSYVVKRVFKRVRPTRDKGAFGHALRDASFPSGHSLTAFCFWMPLIAVVFRTAHSSIAAIAFAVIAVSIVLLTGLSRFYMAVHWPSDVAGGFLIGGIWTTVFLLISSGWF